MINRICMVVYGHYFSDARVKNYARYLSRKGIDVDILALKEPDKELREEKISNNITVYYLTEKYIGKKSYGYIWGYAKYFVVAFWKLTILSIKNKYKIIDIHNMPNFLIFSAIIPKLLQSKVILDMHDIMSLTFKSKYGNNKYLAWLLMVEEKLSALLADKVICADHFQEEFLIKQRRINKKKITVIMNLPALDIFEYRNERRENKTSFDIVYHGTVTYRLGVDMIIKAIAVVRESIPVRFYLYGSGDYMNECLDLIKKEGLQDVVFASNKFFAVEDLPDLLKDKDIGIIGNRRVTIAKYLLPVKMMEYMALGIPVIAPRLENISSYFNESLVCFYNSEDVEDLANKIIMMCNDAERRKELSENALDYMKKHNWEQEFDKYMEIINEYSS